MASLVTRLAAVPARQRIGSTCWLLTKASQSNSSATQSQATPTTAFSRLRGLRSSPALFSAPAARRFYSSEQNSSGSSAPPPPPPPPPPKPSSIKFWPFVVVIAMGTGGYILLVNQRLGTLPPQEKQQKELNERGTPLPSFKLRSTPTFSPEDVTVVFVLGGPGAGKGTQCARLVKQYGFAHLSAGDLLRAEQDRPGSQFGQLIRDCIRNGEIVPMEVTIQLLENAMRDVMKSSSAKQHKFLIDGFPRKMDQAVAFEQAVCPAKLVLFFDCPESELERRLMERGKTSGRDDDNAASIRKRFRTFVETSMPVVDAFAAEGRVVTIDATPKPDAVFAATQKQLAKQLGI